MDYGLQPPVNAHTAFIPRSMPTGIEYLMEAHTGIHTVDSDSDFGAKCVLAFAYTHTDLSPR